MVVPIWPYADRSDTGLDVLNSETVSTEYGPLSGLDREFITKVRLAGLGTARRPAGPAGTTPAVRTAGEHLV